VNLVSFSSTSRSFYANFLNNPDFFQWKMICINSMDVTFHDANDYIIEAVYLLEQDKIIYIDAYSYLTLLAKIESSLLCFFVFFYHCHRTYQIPCIWINGVITVIFIEIFWCGL